VHQRISAARITERAGAYLAVGELEQLHHSLNVGHQLVVRLVALLGRADLDELDLVRVRDRDRDRVRVRVGVGVGVGVGVRVRVADLDGLNLVELVLPEEPPRVAPARARLGAEARRVGHVGDR